MLKQTKDSADRALALDFGNSVSASARGETRNLRYKYKPFQEIIAWLLAEMGLINEFRIGDLAPGSGI